MFKKMIYVFLLLLIPLCVFPISWEIKTDVGIIIELSDVTRDCDYLNQIMERDYKYIEAKIYNGNPNVNFYFFPPGSKSLFIDKNDETFRHKDIYFEFVNKLPGEKITQYQDVIDKLSAINLGYKESAKILLVFSKDFDFFDARIFKIEFGSGLCVEYYRKDKAIVIIDEYNKLNLEEE